jgi:uncharacterized damage-inducible protein DinB
MTTAIESYRNLAAHNRTMNQRLYSVIMGMSPAAIYEDRGGFFRSVFGGLNHIMFGDHFILTRVKRVYAAPSTLDEIADQWDFEPTKSYASEIGALFVERARVDDALAKFAGALAAPDLEKRITLPNGSATLWVLLDHLFQHQTHHRGQVTTLLTQLGVSYGTVENPIEIYLGRQGAA